MSSKVPFEFAAGMGWCYDCELDPANCSLAGNCQCEEYEDEEDDPTYWREQMAKEEI